MEFFLHFSGFQMGGDLLLERLVESSHFGMELTSILSLLSRLDINGIFVSLFTCACMYMFIIYLTSLGTFYYKTYT